MRVTQNNQQEMVVTNTIERQTQNDDSQFAEVLRRGTQVLAHVAGAVVNNMPGGEIVSAAVQEGVDNVTESSTGSTTSSNNSSTNEENSQDEAWRLTQETQEFNLFYLQLQEELAQENRRFSTLSNVLKSQHDTVRTAINNIK